MWLYLARRTVHLAAVLIVVSLLAFLLVHLSGDPAALLAPLDAKPADVQRVRQLYGLDKPLYQQYLSFLGGAVHGDLGQSYKYGTDAVRLVVGRLPATLSLAVAATLLSVLIGVPLGIKAGAHPDGATDYFTAFFSFLAISVPSFFLGIILILFFAGKLRWLPPSGRGTWLNLIMPTVTLSAYSVGLITRLVRASVIEALQQDYIRTARAKGLSQRVVLYRHALKNSLLPAVTVIGLQFGGLLGGSVVVESVFAWPGVGWLMLQAIQGRDIPLVRAVVLIVGALFVIINLLVDLTYGWLDPRITYKG